jgi:rifampicin phosphotransferase
MTDWTAPAPGPWQQDSAHTPVSQAASMADIYPAGFNRGFSETFARYGVLLDRLAMATVNGFTYHQPQPFDMPGPDGPLSEEQIGAEFGRRLELAAMVFETKLWRQDLEQWDNEAKPNSIDRHRSLGDVDFAALDNEQLADHVRRVVENTSEMVYQHHRFNMAAMLPVGDFALQASGMTGRPPEPMLAALDGYSPVSGIMPDDMRAAIDKIRSNPAAVELCAGDGDPQDRLMSLRALVPEVDDYVRSVGFRLVDGFDVTNPTVAECPDLILGKFFVALDATPGDARARADQFAAELRTEVPHEQQVIFDELLHEARTMYRLRDERGLYSDMSAIGLVRWALLEVGRRAESDGRLEDADLALDANIDEAIAMIGGGGPSTEVLSQRRARRLELTSEGAPRFLGPPPPAPPPADQLPAPLARLMSAIGFLIEGILGQMDAPAGEDGVVIGIPASAGTTEGTARLILSTEDLMALEPGEIVVAPTTGEAFNAMLHLIGGIVTDHGSFACHAGIIAREMGFPAVVGTIDATSRIASGDILKLDGSTGEVHIIG